MHSTTLQCMLRNEASHCPDDILFKKKTHIPIEKGNKNEKRRIRRERKDKW